MDNDIKDSAVLPRVFIVFVCLQEHAMASRGQTWSPRPGGGTAHASVHSVLPTGGLLRFCSGGLVALIEHFLLALAVFVVCEFPVEVDGFLEEAAKCRL